MAKLSPMNPLGHIINRQLNGNVVIRNTLFKERLAGARNLFRKDLLAHYGCVNAIQFSSEGELLISGGDDRRVLLWSVPEIFHGRFNPISMATNHISNIFCLEFDSINSKIYSGGNDDQVLVHDLKMGTCITKLAHKKPVYGLSINPLNDFIIATACDDGRILMYDIRSSTTDSICIAKEKTAFHSVMFNPLNTRLLATANSEEGICLWDCRKPKETLVHYDSCTGSTSGISVCFNSTGSRLLALRRRLPPVLYATQSQSAICQFYHPQYYNSCTMKTCCFAGDNDEYILSGSDDFNLYMWRIPKQGCEWGMSHMVLQGHRSIVNQVCYNKQNNLIASSGVEKMVKLWSSLPIGTWDGSLSRETNGIGRSVYSHDDYIYLVGNSGQRISHDYSDQSIEEDCRMMAFFDSLIQREIEGWDSPSEATVSTDGDSDSSIIQADVQGPTYLPRTTLHYSRRLLEENKKQKPNRIAHLIAQKRSRLAKMAKYKSSSSLHRNSRQKRNKNSKNKNPKATKSKKLLRRSYHSIAETSSSPSHSEKENRKHKLHHSKSERYARSKKFRSRHSFKDICENSISNSSIDGPSTSTGITGSGNSVFRVYEQDSDDEVVPPNGCIETRRTSEENNFVNIIPTPLNGTHDLCINALDMSNHNGNGSNIYTNGNEASTSSGTIKRRSCDFLLNYDSDSSDYEYNCTPVKRQNNNCEITTPDSGIVTAACSSGSSYSKHLLPCSSRYNGNSSDDPEYPYETFRKRTKKARLNIRKQIIGDSDSN